MNCRACKGEIEDTKQSFLINNQGDRICKGCGEAIMEEENKKNPGLIRVVDLENGEKGLVKTK